MKTTPHKSNRRDFVKQSALATPVFMFAPTHVLGREGSKAPSDKLAIVAIGVGGRGGHNLGQFDDEKILALCDVDEERAAKSFNKHEKLPKYQDFRDMLDKEKNYDAVVVSTPDHTHAVAAMAAIERYKHVYVEKPLAHTIHEVRALMKAARKHNVQTQLGNQGHSYNDIRKICEWVWSGAIGEVKEVQAWYTRSYGNGKPRPEETPPVPKTLNWDLWLGPAAYRPYHSAYLPGSWRSWSDFGTGVLGDWVCHILDPTFWALKLRTPIAITAYNKDNDYSPERFAVSSKIEYEFAARHTARGKMPPVKVTWYYGEAFEHPLLEGLKLNDWNQKAGALLIGDKGAILHGSHGGGGAKILPESRAKEIDKPKAIIPRVDGGHHQDWIRACKEGKPASSNFTYGGPLTELALLGVIATVFDRERLEWDYAKRKFTNNEKATEYTQSPYRKGWSL